MSLLLLDLQSESHPRHLCSSHPKVHLLGQLGEERVHFSLSCESKTPIDLGSFERRAGEEEEEEGRLVDSPIDFLSARRASSRVS
jgi:hypothetical protein